MTTHQLNNKHIQLLAHKNLITLHKQLLMNTYKQLGQPFLYVQNNVLHCRAGNDILMLPMRNGHLAIIQHLLQQSLFMGNLADNMQMSRTDDSNVTVPQLRTVVTHMHTKIVLILMSPSSLKCRGHSPRPLTAMELDFHYTTLLGLVSTPLEQS